MSVKKILSYTNPVTIVFGAPILFGIILSVMCSETFRKTSKIVKSIDRDIQ